MKFLIAIKNTKEKSKNILEIGCKIAEGFSADLTICYIGKQSKASSLDIASHTAA